MQKPGFFGKARLLAPAQPLSFVPVMRGGQSRAAVSQALALLRADEQLAEMESLLAFFATFVMTPDEVVKLMRWNMVMLRESPWYLEIEAEAMQKGLQQGQQQGQQLGQAELVLRLLARRFGAVPASLAGQVQALPSAQMPALLDAILDAASLEEVAAALERLAAVASNGQAA
jgi:predicted transposase YdaD